MIRTTAALPGTMHRKLMHASVTDPVNLGNRREMTLLELAKHDDSRKCLRLLAAILETPQLVDRLLQVLRPEHSHAHGNGHKHSHSSGHKRRLP